MLIKQGLRQRIWLEDALKHLHEEDYRGQPMPLARLADALNVSVERASALMLRLSQAGLAKRDDEICELTDKGREMARSVLRAHRLYETHLARNTGLRQSLWHKQADTYEHFMSEQQVDELAQVLGEPCFDPHGDPIPTRTGELPEIRGQNLLQMEQGWEGRIAHIEDEPESLYAQIAALNLAPGMLIQVADRSDTQVRLRVDGSLIDLTEEMAGQFRVEPLLKTEVIDPSMERLSALQLGEFAEIQGLTQACYGPERSRLLDLGVVPGSGISIDLISPHGSPIAYHIRGASIALRREQADTILIKKVEKNE